MFTSDPEFVIAIGASAGGIEELYTFFDHTPLDSAAYVIVQHLSPDFKSQMVKLLARHSLLRVKVSEDGMPVKRNEVYLVPNDKFMTIRDGALFLTDKELVVGPHHTINTFFNSLAADCGRKAIGVILSGLGSDGTAGIKEIKKAGGLVIVRDPDTTSFSSMPVNAIATGIVDYILEPSQMPGIILDYTRQEPGFTADNANNQENLASIVALIKANSPLDFTDYKQTTILRRTERRAKHNNFTSLGNYLDFLKVNPSEIEGLAQEFLISVTAFFRDKEAFKNIEKNVLPAILASLAPGEELRMWVAGCATGEEAYSLAILICEQLAERNQETVVKIFATDIDTLALKQAGKGIYAASIAKDISPERLNKYFLKEEDQYRVSPGIRKMVIFAQHDLVKNPPYCNMHLISCRNLLIYLTPALQKKIYAVLLFGLKREGYLFLGSSENPLPIMDDLEVIDKKSKLYRSLKSNRALRFEAFSLPELKHKPPVALPEDSSHNLLHSLPEAVNAALISELDYLAICIDEKHQVVKTYGDTTRFLLQKNFNSTLTELLPPPLAVAFNTLFANSLTADEKLSVTGIKIKQQDATISVRLSISRLPLKKGMPTLFLVTFKEENIEAPAVSDSMVFDEKLYHGEYTLNLEKEVRELKEKLRATYLQLDASNENMQSFNEELLSANEEMQSTNEEMQSVNEELHTINADYQLKNKELLELNDDLNNYFRSNINGQLFVDNDLLLMKFSPGTVKHINLLATDIGRPLSNISTNIKFETLIEDIKQVLNKGSIITKEMEAINGRWYQIMTMPYLKQPDNQIEGAIISFNDVTELKTAQLELSKRNEILQRINADLDNFVYTASHDMLAPLNHIEGSIGLMNTLDVADPELKQYLKIINASIKKFRSLITEIATVAKVESDMVTQENVDLTEVIDNIEWSLVEKINASQAIITRELNVKHILFSKKNLRSLLYNLISNGIKFKSNHPPVIHIQTKKEGDYIVLSVRDNGLGISERNQERIFNKYERINQDVEGQGIGLFLTKKIVHATGGDIKVESELGQGSTFTIYFKAESPSLN
ncbi:chemotaxis protein CheB [Pontibacter pamirensis]|uniref:chemotaxis protein CheB n=1 Tax=Pontibacter pamirensis TaxID=2562824 RepID=UPI00138A5E45|nr:chemotaxis protein CheB [Pontibacter pamirensis]